MGFLKRSEQPAQALETVPVAAAPVTAQKVTFLAVWLGLVASIGGFMFGYVSGQIS